MTRISGLLLLYGFSLFSVICRSDAFYARIVNGTQANEGEFPFLVSLRRASDGRHKCGASLINRVWVLTAAHCVVKTLPEQVNIQYGSNQLDANSTKVSNISRIVVHENYEPGNLHANDLALLRLQTPLKFSSKVRAVHLPAAQQDTADASPAVLIGWGLNAVSLRHCSNLQHFCAGTIIQPQWILTAAHCFKYIKDPNKLVVQYGSSQLTHPKSKFVNVSEIRLHEGYSPTIAIHDIALLKLAHRLPLNEADIVELAEGVNLGDIAATKPPLLLVGWGLNATNGTLQQQLQKVTLHLLAPAECRQQTQSLLHSTNLCAGATNGIKQGQCSGDSGGPLLLNKQQIGIVSWSLKPCGTYPGIYTNVACYAKWIAEHIKQGKL